MFSFSDFVPQLRPFSLAMRSVAGKFTYTPIQHTEKQYKRTQAWPSEHRTESECQDTRTCHASHESHTFSSTFSVCPFPFLFSLSFDHARLSGVTLSWILLGYDPSQIIIHRTHWFGLLTWLTLPYLQCIPFFGDRHGVGMTILMYILNWTQLGSFQR